MTVSRETMLAQASSQENATLWLRTACLQNGLSVSDDQLSQISHYVSLLQSWNQKINLISRKGAGDIWRSHILHSISVLFVLDLQKGATVMDVGTGGGLPGIPLKILRPDLRVTLVDSVQKKVTAVNDILSELKLSGTDAVRGRVEDLSTTSGFRASFDYAIARGVAPLPDLAKWSYGVLKIRPRGLVLKDARPKTPIVPPAMIALKGGNVEEEVERVRAMKNVRSVNVVNLNLKGTEQLLDLEKKVIVVEFQGKG